MKTRWILIFTLFLTLGAIGHANVVTAAGSVCVSNNGVERQSQGDSSCRTQVQGDRAIAINESNAYALGDESNGPAEAFARNSSQANAQTGSSAEATNESSASAVFTSEAYADNSSLADAQNGSYAEATNDSSAIAILDSTAIATDGGCAYADTNSYAEAGSGEIVVVINNVLQTVTPGNVNLYCRVWPPTSPPTGWPLP